MTKPILEFATVRITFDTSLQKLVGKKEEITSISPGASFLFVFNAILVEWPQIQSTYPPGVLGITVNGHPPDTTTPLNDGDTIHLSIPKNQIS